MPSDPDLVSRLVRRGGWDLDDAQARHRKNPDTFWLPPADELAKLKPGASVRLIFRLLDLADQVRDRIEPYAADGSPNLVISHERMWLWVERLDGDELVGILMNRPESTHSRLVPGARVRFRRSDVIDLDLEPTTELEDELRTMAEMGYPPLDERQVLEPEDPQRAPTISPKQAEACASVKARPERPWVFARMLLSKAVQPDVFPVHGVRFRPIPERGDCGWAIWGSEPDMGRAGEKEGFEIVETRALFDRHRPAWDLLALPPGWAFVLGPDGARDVYEAPDALIPDEDGE